MNRENGNVKNQNNILVVDLEATCWFNDEERKGQANEIIEIGYVVADLRNNNILENEGIMVKPTTSKVSEFCTKLTTIKPEDVELAISYGQALVEIKKVMDKYGIFSWASYGDYDRAMFQRQCQREGFLNPMPKKHINISHLVEILNGGQRVGMDRALKLFGLPLHGTHHRGKDDAFNINELLYC